MSYTLGTVDHQNSSIGETDGSGYPALQFNAPHFGCYKIRVTARAYAGDGNESGATQPEMGFFYTVVDGVIVGEPGLHKFPGGNGGGGYPNTANHDTITWERRVWLQSGQHTVSIYNHGDGAWDIAVGVGDYRDITVSAA